MTSRIFVGWGTGHFRGAVPRMVDGWVRRAPAARCLANLLPWREQTRKTTHPPAWSLDPKQDSAWISQFNENPNWIGFQLPCLLRDCMN